MTNIHFPVDGQGTHSLKKQNKTDKSPFHVDATEPDTKNRNKQKQKKQSAKQNTQNSELPNPATESKTQPQNTYETERRKKNRRQNTTSVLLNTRSKQERRKSSSQRDEDLKDNNNQFGIDTEA